MFNDDILTINVKPAGNACNLNCKYCDIIHSSNIDNFCFETYKKHLEKIQKQYKFIHIVLHGGEPLLAGVDKIADVIDVTNSLLENKCDIQIQTNGLLLTPEVTSFLCQKQCKISISFDPNELDLRYSAEVRASIKMNIADAIFLGASPGILSVVHAQNKNYFVSFMDELLELGVKYWTINKVRMQVTSALYLPESTYLNVLLIILSNWLERELYPDFYIQPLMDLISPGMNHSCHFNSLAKKCSYFASYAKSQYSTVCEHCTNCNLSFKKECGECNIFDFCGGGCPADRYDGDFCESRKNFYNNIFQLQNMIGANSLNANLQFNKA